VAALIKKTTGLEPEIVPGDRGEFTIWVGGEHVAVKDAANACVAGAKLTIHTVTPGNAVVVSGATQALLGYALANGSGGVVRVKLTCL